jgi:hypothetical protein
VQALTVTALVIALAGVAFADRPAQELAPIADEEFVPGDLINPPPGPPLPPAPPTPAPEIAKLGHALAGTWTCKGVAIARDGSSTPVTTRRVVALGPGAGWVRTAATITRHGTPPMHALEYVTFDGIARRWTSLVLTGRGAHVVTTSLGEQRGEWTWTGTRTAPGAAVPTRHHQRIDGRLLTSWTEIQDGSSWRKVSEASCAR